MELRKETPLPLELERHWQSWNLCFMLKRVRLCNWIPTCQAREIKKKNWSHSLSIWHATIATIFMSLGNQSYSKFYWYPFGTITYIQAIWSIQYGIFVIGYLIIFCRQFNTIFPHEMLDIVFVDRRNITFKEYTIINILYKRNHQYIFNSEELFCDLV